MKRIMILVAAVAGFMLAADKPTEPHSSPVTDAMRKELFKAQRDYLLAERNAKAPMEQWEKTGQKEASDKIVAATKSMQEACNLVSKNFDENALDCVDRPKQSAAASEKK